MQSRGLGRKELVMDFREYEVVREGDEVVIRGSIREPVRWDFSIRMCQDDLAGLAKVATRRTTIGFLVRALTRRKKDHHWSGDRDEHVREAKEAGAALNEKLRSQREERDEQAREKGEREAEAAQQARERDVADAAIDDAAADASG